MTGEYKNNKIEPFSYGYIYKYILTFKRGKQDPAHKYSKEERDIHLDFNEQIIFNAISIAIKLFDALLNRSCQHL